MFNCLLCRNVLKLDIFCKHVDPFVCYKQEKGNTNNKGNKTKIMSQLNSLVGKASRVKPIMFNGFYCSLTTP